MIHLPSRQSHSALPAEGRPGPSDDNDDTDDDYDDLYIIGAVCQLRKSDVQLDC